MPFAVKQLLEWTGGRIANGDALTVPVESVRVQRPAPLGVSTADELAFFFSRDYERELPSARPGVLITGEPFVEPLRKAALPFWTRTVVIACADPYLALALLSEKFAGELSSVAHLGGAAEKLVHPTAVIDPTARLDDRVQVGPHCVIEAGARIGTGTILYSGCTIGRDARVGKDCVLFPGVTLYEWTELGDRVRLHAGVVLGSDGFGYAPRRSAGKVVGHQKIYHLGRVVVGNDVEIGANSCVDRSTFGETRIADHAKLDNLVHVGHNSNVGEGAVVCGGTCLAGRASLGRFAYVGGLTGVTNNVHVGDGASVGALSLVTKDVPPGGTAVGNPQRDYREHFRAHAALNRLCTKRGGGQRGESNG